MDAQKRGLLISGFVLRHGAPHAARSASLSDVKCHRCRHHLSIGGGCMQPGQANDQRLVNELEEHAETLDRWKVDFKQSDDDDTILEFMPRAKEVRGMMIGDYAHFED